MNTIFKTLESSWTSFFLLVGLTVIASAQNNDLALWLLIALFLNLLTEVQTKRHNVEVWRS